LKFGNLSKPFVDLGFGIIYHQFFLTLRIRTFLTQSIQNQLIKLLLNANEEFGLKSDNYLFKILVLIFEIGLQLFVNGYLWCFKIQLNEDEVFYNYSINAIV
jgi:hypothetical protein